jgi:flagellar protein FlaI
MLESRVFLVGEFMKILATYEIRSENVPAAVRICEREDEYINTYEIEQPKIGSATQSVLAYLKEKIIGSVDVKISEMLDPREADAVRSRFMERADEMIGNELVGIGDAEKRVLIGRLAHEMLGLGDLELLLADDELEEIVVNGSKEPVRVYHKKFGWLKSNLTLQSEEQVYNYASIIGRRVGKQITTLNPLMDAHLTTGHRVSATLFPVSSKGNGITIRKFAKNPWTIVHLIDPAANTLNVDVAALLWLCVQYEMNIIVAGGTASGKTTFLNSILVFTPPNQRVISIEDSVSGEEEMFVERNGRIERTTVASLVDAAVSKNCQITEDGCEIAANSDNTKVLSMTPRGEMELKEPRSFIRHKVNKPMFEVTLASGRRIKVTRDHSLFTLDDRNRIVPVKASELHVGGRIATPRALPFEGNLNSIDLGASTKSFCRLFIEGEPVRKRLESAQVKGNLRKRFGKSRVRHYARLGVIPADSYNEVFYGAAPTADEKRKMSIRSKCGASRIPILLDITSELAFMLGNWIADGCYDKNSVIISADDEESRAQIKKAVSQFGITTKMHSDGISLMLNSKALKLAMQALGFGGNAYTKKVPPAFFNLERPLMANFLKGIFSGDGWVRRNEVAIRLASRTLLNDLQSMLLFFGVPLRTRNAMMKDRCYEGRVSGTPFLGAFAEHIGFAQGYKMDKLKNAASKERHDVSDSIPLPKYMYRILKRYTRQQVGTALTYKSWKSWHRAYTSGRDIGRVTLQNIAGNFNDYGAGLDIFMEPSRFMPQDLFEDEEGMQDILESAKNLAFNDVFWDRIREIKNYDYNGYVYDLSVPGNESFVCNNIVAHNTRELVLPDFLQWTPLTTREPNPEGRGEITMLDLMVNSLRMRPDRIVLGEIRRQREAEVLFEAMHTGHSVYSTLHADDAEQARNRMTSPPINLPESMIGAVHAICVQYRQRRTGIRRTFELAEVVPDEKSVRVNVLYKWRPRDDVLEKYGEAARLYSQLTMHTGMTQREIDEDISDKRSVLQYMLEKKINTVNDVGRVIATYYRDKERLMKAVAGKKDLP